MRIAVNTRFLLAEKLEGIGHYTFETLKHLVADHPKDQFIFFFDRKYDPAFVFAENITPVVLFPPARLPFLWRWWFDYSVTRALKKYKADVFYSPDMFLSLRTEVPTLLVVHDLAFLHFPEYIPQKFRNYYAKFTSKYLSKAAHIMTVSAFSKEDVKRAYGIPDHKITLAYNDVSALYKKPRAIDEELIKQKYTSGCDYFYYLGAVHPRKNVDGLIRAFHLFKQKHPNTFKLVIAGRKSWMNDELDHLYLESPNKSDIVFLGHLGDDAFGLMRSCKTFVYVSKFEGFGIPILEAIYLDKNVICSNVSSMPEVSGAAAILVDPFNDQEIADAMWASVSDMDLQEHLARARKVQKKKFSWKKTAATIYEKLEAIRLI